MEVSQWQLNWLAKVSSSFESESLRLCGSCVGDYVYTVVVTAAAADQVMLSQ